MAKPWDALDGVEDAGFAYWLAGLIERIGGTEMTDIDPATLNDLREIRRLITEMYQHWETHSDDHHCKSSEGAISLDFPPFFWRDGQVQRPSVSIYSYVMGPHRSHHFEDSSAALREVRRWHQREMNHNYEEGWL